VNLLSFSEDPSSNIKTMFERYLASFSLHNIVKPMQLPQGIFALSAISVQMSANYNLEEF